MSINKVKPGDIVEIKVGGKQYTTIIDKNGVQRFKMNEVIRRIVDEMYTRFMAHRARCNASGIEYPETSLSLNSLYILYQQGEIPFEDYLEFYTMLGLSVSGFTDLSCFSHLAIENPLWD